MSVQMDRVHNLGPVSGPGFVQHLHNGRNGHVVEKSPSPDRVLQQASCTDDKELQIQMEQSLRRSVTLVIWYKSNCDPVRLTHEIATFPLFQLSHFPYVVSDLELTPTSYIDAYNQSTGHWEQHLISTVRTVESEQRLLYKLRKSLLAGLADDECKGLTEELALQTKKKLSGSHLTSSPTSASQLKRPLSENAEVPSAKRFYLPEGYPAHPVYMSPVGYMMPPPAMPYPPHLASPPIAGPSHPRNGETNETTTTSINSPFHPSMNLQSPVVPPTPLYSPNSPNGSGSPSTTSRASFPQHPHPPLKRWPNDYTVSEIAAGFRAVDAMITQSPTMTQRAAFERVFGCRYVKSTVCRHRGLYRKADAGVRRLFEGMGNDERAVWGEFVRRVEGRPPAGKASVIGQDEEESPFHGEIQGGDLERQDMSSNHEHQNGSNQAMAQMETSQMDMEAGLQAVSDGHPPAFDPGLDDPSSSSTVPQS
ncbi:hypothetical protein F5I97DRAFT_1932296 [Phlebopus sp. FC_14]|nr:hypothetical protein F5I97DRAFT_1932296 [Phlebopus sp. FC_14]